MDKILDGVWNHFEVVLNHTVIVLHKVISPLEAFGPGFVIFVLSALVVFFTRFVAKAYVTKRYVQLKKEFEHWQQVREEAMKHPDPEKGKTLARNIDQAELNRAYYDYFFEGMLKNIVTNVLPILLTAAFITRIYTPENLMARFGEKWVFNLSFGGFALTVSSLFWYVISILVCFVLYAVCKKFFFKKRGPASELAESNI